MGKTIILRLINLPPSLLVLVASLVYMVLSNNARKDCFLVRNKLSTHKFQPDLSHIILYLKLAEDHRFDYHWGFDFIAIFRSIFNYINLRKLEGASTITQQFVRTCTKRYEVKLSRKLHEIALSCLISFTSRKVEVANAYLAIAYYGVGISGPFSAMRYLGKLATNDICSHPAALTALLKYPAPQEPSLKWLNKLEIRTMHISRRCKKYG